jgi:SPP1 family predicted phage head-tail adaptor
MTNAGRMREVATIERPSTPGTLGQPTWETFAQVRAELEPVKGRELSAPQIGGSETTHKVTVRYLAGVRGDMRVRFASIPDRVFTVTHVLNPFGHRETQIFCKEVMTGEP